MKPLPKLNPSRLGPLSLLFHRSARILMKYDIWPLFDQRTPTRLKMRQTPSRLHSCTSQDITIVVYLMQCIEMFHPLVICIVTIHMGTLESNGVICMNHPRNDCIDSRPRSKVQQQIKLLKRTQFQKRLNRLVHLKDEYIIHTTKKAYHRQIVI